ncbi:MAG: CpaF family protein [Fimbriimonadaceae bacterium]|nr:CpaF family protein [Fimbriimonadaceae bacterium]
MSSLLDRLNRINTVQDAPAAEVDTPAVEAAAGETTEGDYYSLKHSVFQQVIDGVDDRAVSNADEDRLRIQIEDLLGRHLKLAQPLEREVRQQLILDFLAELIGYGPIDPFLNDPTVSRIVVNAPDDVYVERLNRLVKTEVRFKDDQHIMELGRKIAIQLKSRVDESTPMLDRKIGGDGRVKVVFPPLSRTGPQITIHKGLKNPFLVEAEEQRTREMEREDPFVRLKLQIMERVVRDIDTDVATGNDVDRLRNQVENNVDQLLLEYGAQLSRSERTQVVQEVLNEMKGLGPLEPLLADPTVSEVMVNASNQVYVERKGKLILTDVKFRDDAHVLHTIEKIVAPLGRRIDEASPMVDARLKEGPAAGSRVNAIIPPLALKGPCLTIRKFSADPLTINDLISFGTVTAEAAQFLDACVKARMNIVVSGGTGSGKTTLLNILSGFIPNDERIVTVEDAAELQLRQTHVVTLETRPANVEGKGAVTIRDLVKNTLRMRPDRVVVGECRGGEALDMLQAMNTGHDGSLTTGHANSPREMLARLETMVLMAGMDLPLKAIREQISSAVDLIVQQARMKDGSRKIEYITEVVGMEGDIITLQDLFVFHQEGVTDEGKVMGKLGPTGIRPRCYDRIIEHGIRLPMDMFRAADR